MTRYSSCSSAEACQSAVGPSVKFVARCLCGGVVSVAPCPSTNLTSIDFRDAFMATCEVCNRKWTLDIRFRRYYEEYVAPDEDIVDADTMADYEAYKSVRDSYFGASSVKTAPAIYVVSRGKISHRIVVKKPAVGWRDDYRVAKRLDRKKSDFGYGPLPDWAIDDAMIAEMSRDAKRHLILCGFRSGDTEMAESLWCALKLPAFALPGPAAAGADPVGYSGNSTELWAWELSDAEDVLVAYDTKKSETYTRGRYRRSICLVTLPRESYIRVRRMWPVTTSGRGGRVKRASKYSSYYRWDGRQVIEVPTTLYGPY